MLTFSSQNLSYLHFWLLLFTYYLKALINLFEELMIKHHKFYASHRTLSMLSCLCASSISAHKSAASTNEYPTHLIALI